MLMPYHVHCASACCLFWMSWVAPWMEGSTEEQSAGWSTPTPFLKICAPILICMRGARMGSIKFLECGTMAKGFVSVLGSEQSQFLQYEYGNDGRNLVHFPTLSRVCPNRCTREYWRWRAAPMYRPGHTSGGVWLVVLGGSSDQEPAMGLRDPMFWGFQKLFE